MSSAASSLSVLIVNYNSGALLLDCLDSLVQQAGASSWQIVVVDNASSDASGETAKAQYPVIELLRLPSNVGFGAANNRGLERCIAPHVLMLNPDTRLDGGSVESLRCFLEQGRGIGLVGPRLIGTDGRLQTSMRNFPTIASEFVECMFLHRLSDAFGDRFGQEIRVSEKYAHPMRADWVSGSAMLARLDTMRAVGGFDEGFFLYSEEIDLCKRLTDLGQQVWYHPGLTVMHVGGVCQTDSALSLERQRSKLRYMRKHHGPSEMLVFSTVILARLTLRGLLWLLASPVKGRAWGRRGAVALTTLLHYPVLVYGALRSSPAIAASSQATWHD
jgi:N-acetylglucosaminyl-diphospho-decaprenol L-rhamnosyltransferase